MSELISGKEALIALANGDEVEFENPFQNFWVDIKSLTITEIEGGYYVCSEDVAKVKTQFRRKPRTITLNGIEVPAPFEPKEGDEVWFLNDDSESGYGCSAEYDKAIKALFWLVAHRIRNQTGRCSIT